MLCFIVSMVAIHPKVQECESYQIAVEFLWLCDKNYFSINLFFDLHAMAFKINVSFKFQSYLGDFPKVSTGWPDLCCWTSHFAAISFFQEFLLKSHLLYAYYLEFDKSGWIVLIKSEILIMTGMVWPVSSAIFISILILNFAFDS